VSNIQQLLATRKLPELLQFQDGAPVKTTADWQLRRREILEIFQQNEFGFLPPAPQCVYCDSWETDERFCAGNAPLTKLALHAELANGKAFTFPVYQVIPKADKPLPAFIHISFRADMPDRYMPGEEICDNGFALFSFCYQDITRDNADFADGLAEYFCTARETNPASPGKIALWAWAAMRVMDYIETLPQIDQTRVAVVGHSRLGKTALFAGAMDERFALTISNDSGCGGAALSRSKTGENIADICRAFPFWFCKNYQNFAEKETNAPFDQHFLLACMAPRGLYAASASEDAWADPTSEFLACAAASEVWALFGKAGLSHQDRPPQSGEDYPNGCIGYHLRSGCHYFSRYDWIRYMRFLRGMA